MAAPSIKEIITTIPGDHTTQEKVSDKGSVQPKHSEMADKLLVQAKNYFMRQIEISKVTCFEARCPEGSEATVTVIQGHGSIEIEGKVRIVSPMTLVKLTVGKVVKFVSSELENLKLCYVCAHGSSTDLPSEQFKEGTETYIREEKDCVLYSPNPREKIYELFGVANGQAKKHSVAIVDLLPDGSSDRHFHPVIEESYYIVEGSGKLVISEQTSEVNPGDLAVMPVGEKHKISTIGNKTLRLLAICAGPWTPTCGDYS